MCPERSVMMSLICDLPGDCWKTGVGRVAVDFGAGQGAKRSAVRSDLGQASNASQRQNQRNPGGREAEGQLAASLVRSSPLRGCASLAPCHPPFCLYARPIPVFQQSLTRAPPFDLGRGALASPGLVAFLRKERNKFGR